MRLSTVFFLVLIILTSCSNREEQKTKDPYLVGEPCEGCEAILEYNDEPLKPRTYPSRSKPAHIHYTVLEPNGKYYWIGSCHFEGDPLLTEKEISPDAPRGGSSGLLKLKKKGDLWIGERNIIMGKNIPDYN